MVVSVVKYREEMKLIKDGNCFGGGHKKKKTCVMSEGKNN